MSFLAELASALQQEGAKILQAKESRKELLVTTSQVENWLSRAAEVTARDADDTSEEGYQAIQVTN